MTRSLLQGDELPHPAGPPHGDRVDMRRYAPGDPLRLVLWKVYARSGELMVRTAEPAVSPSLRVAAFLCTGPQDEAAAAAAYAAVAWQSLGERWRLGVPGLPVLATTVEEAGRLICQARDWPQDLGAPALSVFTTEARAQGCRQLVLFVPPTPGPWLAHAVDALRAWRGAKACVVAFDHDAGPRVTGRLRGLVLAQAEVPPGQSRTSSALLSQVCRALEDAGAAVMLVHRPSGREAAAARRGAAA